MNQNLENFKITDNDFNNFKSFLKSNDFSFETKTEEAFNKALEIAEDENLKEPITSEYKELISALAEYKASAINKNKEKLSVSIRDEIIKRYFYAEGLYEYYKANNAEINKAINVLSNPSLYNQILN